MDDDRHVRKSNFLIDGKYRFGLIEQKILLTILSKIKIADTDFKPYKVQWNQLKRVTRNSVKTVAQLNDACDKLKNRTIVVKEGGIEHYFGFLSGWSIEVGKSVEFRIDPCLRDQLLNLLENGNFTLFRLECVLGLSSTYSIRLYEILKMYEWKKQPVTISLKHLHWTLDVPEGSKASRRFDVFKTKILDRAKSDLEKHTDIKFTYRKVVELRRVVALEITITENKKYQTTVAGHISTREKLKDGDVIRIAGKRFVVEGDCARDDEGAPLPIGIVNKLYREGQANKE